MVLYLGKSKITPLNGSTQTYTCVNKTGNTINTGDRVYIASNTNLILITFDKFVKSVGWTGIALETINNNESGTISATISHPATNLELYSRVANCATVAGFFTDENNTTYAVCVLDANTRYYGTGGFVNTHAVPSYNTADEALNSKESATYLCSILSENGWSYPGTVTYNNVIYPKLRPNVPELQMIINKRNELESFDPTASSSSSNVLLSRMTSNLTFTCTGSDNQLWYYYNRWNNSNAGSSSYNLRLYILEIPVSSN